MSGEISFHFLVGIIIFVLLNKNNFIARSGCSIHWNFVSMNTLHGSHGEFDAGGVGI